MRPDATVPSEAAAFVALPCEASISLPSMGVLRSTRFFRRVLRRPCGPMTKPRLRRTARSRKSRSAGLARYHQALNQDKPIDNPAIEGAAKPLHCWLKSISGARRKLLAPARQEAAGRTSLQRPTV